MLCKTQLEKVLYDLLSKQRLSPDGVVLALNLRNSIEVATSTGMRARGYCKTQHAALLTDHIVEARSTLRICRKYLRLWCIHPVPLFRFLSRGGSMRALERSMRRRNGWARQEAIRALNSLSEKTVLTKRDAEYTK